MDKVFEKFFEGSNEVQKPEVIRNNGKIINLNDKGWGFISSIEIPFTRVFFHWTSLKQNTLNFKDLKVGMKCSFTPISIPEKGIRAVKIEVVE